MWWCGTCFCDNNDRDSECCVCGDSRDNQTDKPNECKYNPILKGEAVCKIIDVETNEVIEEIIIN